MDETRLHGLLTDALTDEPPMGPVAQHALHKGRRIRRRRWILTAGGTGAALAAVGLSVTVAIPAAGPPPAALGPGPTEHTVFAMDGATGTITPVTQDSHLLGRPIRVGQDLSPAVFSPDGKILGVISYADDRLVTVDVAAGTVSQRFERFAAKTYPGSIAISPDDQTAYVALTFGAKVLPFDLASGSAGTPITVGGQNRAIAITPDGRTMYVLGGGPIGASGKDAQGSVTPVTLATGQAGQPIPVGDHPVTMAMSADGKRILVGNSEQGSVHDGSVTVIDTTTNTAGKPLATGQVSAAGAAFSPDGQTAYIVNGDAGTLVPIDLATQTLGKPIMVGVVKQPSGPSADPLSVAITPDGKTAYVLTPSLDPQQNSRVTPVDTATGTVGKPIQVPGTAGAIAVSPDGGTVYVGINQNGKMIMISTSTNQVSQTVQVAKRGDIEFATGP
jgi:DNA-binding beta-propeller fold protein YncE